MQKLDQALSHAKDPQTRIRTLNTRTRILLDCAAAGGSCGLDPLNAADQALAQSEKLDSANGYTMRLRAEWLERTGRGSQAQDLRQQADALRRVPDEG